MFPFEVDATSDVPLWVQLRQRLVYLINSGYFKPGDQLPTVRGLAADISINYNTVNKAYLSLVSEGYLESTRGRGVFVRDLDAEVDEEYSKEVSGVMDDCVAACRDLGLSLDDTLRCMAKKIKQLKKNEGQD
ncbi:MAG: GntR family transcriptional regulator [Raoultibacter sp.]